MAKTAVRAASERATVAAGPEVEAEAAAPNAVAGTVITHKSSKRLVSIELRLNKLFNVKHNCALDLLRLVSIERRLNKHFNKVINICARPLIAVSIEHRLNKRFNESDTVTVANGQ